MGVEHSMFKDRNTLCEQNFELIGKFTDRLYCVRTNEHLGCGGSLSLRDFNREHAKLTDIQCPHQNMFIESLPKGPIHTVPGCGCGELKHTFDGKIMESQDTSFALEEVRSITYVLQLEYSKASVNVLVFSTVLLIYLCSARASPEDERGYNIQVYSTTLDMNAVIFFSLLLNLQNHHQTVLPLLSHSYHSAMLSTFICKGSRRERDNCCSAIFHSVNSRSTNKLWSLQVSPCQSRESNNILIYHVGLYLKLSLEEMTFIFIRNSPYDYMLCQKRIVGCDVNYFGGSSPFVSFFMQNLITSHLSEFEFEHFSQPNISYKESCLLRLGDAYLNSPQEKSNSTPKRTMMTNSPQIMCTQIYTYSNHSEGTYRLIVSSGQFSFSAVTTVMFDRLEKATVRKKRTVIEKSLVVLRNECFGNYLVIIGNESVCYVFLLYLTAVVLSECPTVKQPFQGSSQCLRSTSVLGTFLWFHENCLEEWLEEYDTTCMDVMNRQILDYFIFLKISIFSFWKTIVVYQLATGLHEHSHILDVARKGANWQMNCYEQIFGCHVLSHNMLWDDKI
ncbi:hypothetical protein EGR_03418 [Echinococcus granulosus]|uniref:Uncharacterized protein n=1 Tax=Echinococcus granulosus TaxID=6210 RepID=W6V5L0_ECHGR|nr:hypothetical protein EGR_03418 [Echinococcus granulosus]EUB61604.1 hypothetical protein EGR_03418 [Echinococcus granulosus]